ncbi:MAG TPA: ThiF family adenylyltransferase, partial [Burkholderiales bacterium]|nr:ThiF family adenylyltransferase [Burkholderiales bacterium]
FGKLTLADPDSVDLTNLQRQILYGTSSVGSPKVDEARKSLHAFNPEVQVVALQKKLLKEDLDRAVADCSVVLDCSDNFATRHAVNRACVRHRKPLVSGAAIRFDGQLAVFDLRKADSACYACLYPEDGEVEEVQCSTMGVFAPLTGVIGAMQAMEAIKLVAGAGEAPAGLLIFDAARTEWRRLGLKRDPACPVCGNQGRM